MSNKKHKQCFHFNAEPDDIKKCVREGHHVLILMRGVTGSGKTYLASEFKEESENYVIYSSDDSNYNNITKNVRSSLTDDVPLVIVDADHEERSSIKKLAELAVSAIYEVYIVEPRTDWRDDASVCKELTKRPVSQQDIADKIEKILLSEISWEHFVNGGEKNVEISNSHDNDYEYIIPASLSKNASLMTITTSSSTNSSSTNSLNTSMPLFSLAPGKNTKEVRNCCTQVNTHDIARALADQPDIEPAGFFDDGVTDLPIVVRRQADGTLKKIQYLERSAQIGPKKDPFRSAIEANRVPRGSSEEIALFILKACFHTSQVPALFHSLQRHGYEKTYQLMEMFGEPFSKAVVPVEEPFLWPMLEAQESYSEPTQTIEEELEERRQEWAVYQFHKANTDTTSDEMIALALSDELNYEEEEHQRTAEDEVSIRYLKALFPPYAGIVEEVYADARYNLEETRKRLKEVYGAEEMQGVPPLKPNSWSKRVAAPTPRAPAPTPIVPMTAMERQNHFLKNVKTSQHAFSQNLSEAQKFAIIAHREIHMSMFDAGRCAGKFKNLAASAINEKLRTEVQKKIREIDQRIMAAHTCPWTLDLHYMSVDGADELLRQAIAAVGYLKKSGLQVSGRIKCITGKGNNSLNGPKIRPRVLSILQAMGLTYKFTGVNEGCLEITVKS